MGKVKRHRVERINLDLLYPVASASLTEIKLESDDGFDDDHDSTDEFSLEELEEMGVIEIPKTTKVIPDGESAFYSAIKNGDDW